MPKMLPLLHHIIIFLHSLNVFARPALLLFLGISIGLTLALYHILKTVTAKQKVDISLDKLSFLWKSQDEISLNLKQEIINEIKTELGFTVTKESKTRLKIASKEVIEEAVKSDIKSFKDENTGKIIDNKNLLAFYYKIEPYLSSDEQNNIIVRLLMFLDKKGGCPSVASGKDTLTKAFKDNLTMIKNVTQYDVFRQITLTDHTLHVCEEALNSLIEKIKVRSEQQAFVAPVIIACLAHDIGKVPDLSNTYATGDHPLISARMLIDLGVPQKSDILDAVASHHKVLTQSSNTIYLMLKAADQAARAKELSDYLNSHSQDSQEFLKSVGVIENSDAANTAPAPPVEIKPEPAQTQTDISLPADTKADNDLSFLSGDNTAPPVLIPAPDKSDTTPPVQAAFKNDGQHQNISLGFETDPDNSDNQYSWINVDKYIDFLKPFINTFNVDKKTNQFYVNSVALTSGIIYFSPFTLGNALTQYMKSIGKEPFHYIKDKAQSEGCLNYISKILYENGQLARVNSGFYSNSVQIIFKNEDVIKAFGILINFEVFGFSSISESTANIPDELKGVKDVIIVKEKIKEQIEEPIDIFS